MKLDTCATFNANEVFGMAERSEQNAGEFYTKAADLHSSRADVQFLRKLAIMEYQHRDIFAAMRANLPPAFRLPPKADPYLKATLYLNTIADSGADEGALSSATPLTASDTLEQIVRRGIQAEMEAIAFYGVLKDAVPKASGKTHIDRILAEERSHVVVLTDELRKLRPV